MPTEKTVVLNIDLLSNNARLLAHVTPDKKLEFSLLSKAEPTVVTAEEANVLLLMRAASRHA